MAAKKSLAHGFKSTVPVNLNLQAFQLAYLEAVAAQNEVSLTEAVRIVINDSAERYGVFDSLKESAKVPSGARMPRAVIDFSHHKHQA